MEVFYVLLVSSNKYTFLPEIYDIFGRETTIKFLELFAGCAIKVPRMEKLEKLARDTAIYVRIEQASPSQQAQLIHTLADEYDLTEDRVRRVYAATKVFLEDELGYRVIRRDKRRG